MGSRIDEMRLLFQLRGAETRNFEDTSTLDHETEDTDADSNSATDQSANDSQHNFPLNPLNPFNPFNPFNTFNVSECEMQSANSSTSSAEEDDHHYHEISDLEELIKRESDEEPDSGTSQSAGTRSLLMTSYSIPRSDAATPHVVPNSQEIAVESNWTRSTSSITGPGQDLASKLADALKERQLSMSADTGQPWRSQRGAASSAILVSEANVLGSNRSTLEPDEEHHYDELYVRTRGAHRQQYAEPVHRNTEVGTAGRRLDIGAPQQPSRVKNKSSSHLESPAEGQAATTWTSEELNARQTAMTQQNGPDEPQTNPSPPSPRPESRSPTYANSVACQSDTITDMSGASSSQVTPGFSNTPEAPRTSHTSSPVLPASSSVRQRRLPSLCAVSATKSGCKWQGCQHLHVCVNWLAGGCSRVRRCRLPHSLSTAHNMTVLRAGGWKEWELETVRRWLCFQTRCERLEAANLPPFCVNHARGFCQAQPCDALHLCPRFLVGVCRVKSCSLGHDLMGDENNRRVVVRSGNGNVTAEKLLKKIAERIVVKPHKH